MTTQETREKQRLIKEIELRSEKLRRAPRSQKEQLTRELEASRRRLEQLNAYPEGEVEG